MQPFDYRYPIDETLVQEIVRDKVKEARDCHRTALKLRQLGYPAIAEWEVFWQRKYMQEARIAKRSCA